MMTRTGSALLAAVRDGWVWLDLGPAPLVRLRGPDARRFCNGMFTNNVRDLPVGGHHRSAMIDDRGRIGGFLDLWCCDEGVFVALVEGIDVPAFLERYERYVVFDEVELEAIDGWRHLSVQGARASSAAPAPEPGRFGVVDPEGWAFTRVRGPGGGVDLVVPERYAAKWLAVPPISPEDVEALRILAGRPRYPQDTGDKRLVAELGLRDELLSFDKGCYLGQETVNRVDVMGQVKRQLAGIRVPSGEGIDVGARITAGDEDLGELTSATLLPNGDLAGLAVLKRPADTPGTAVVVGGRAGTVEALPFALDR